MTAFLISLAIGITIAALITVILEDWIMTNPNIPRRVPIIFGLLCGVIGQLVVIAATGGF